MPPAKLTEAFIANRLTCPGRHTKIEYCDIDFPGLYIEVRATSPGQGTYYLRYKNAQGKTAHQKLGRTTEINLAEARKKAKQEKAKITMGADPRAEERARKAVMTYSEFFNDHYMTLKSSKRSLKRDEQLFRLRIKDVFGDKRLNEITKQQIQTFHAQVKAEGLSAASADHHLKLLRHSLNIALEWELVAKNPATGIKQFNEDNKVERYLDDAELERLVSVLRADDPPMVCRVALFLLSTGARLSEALNADWDHIDRRSRVWTIPATNSKSKRLRSIPLNDHALEVLGRLGTEGNSKHLFINLQTRGRLTVVNKVWGRLRIKAGLPHLRLHDLRHQFASFLVNDGRTLYEVQQLLGHADSKVTQRYSHLSQKTLERAANSASSVLMGAGRGVEVTEQQELEAA
ncbi:tyrosine-type recombinase/integrase [Pseudoduganella sp. DS3]|uniref:Tyrosine-type recombinase/integrase n=1 Tax=Pseudoduganella guangdongensis TaxID=2692179 RepID=A0A6N9HL48_9BURK|nr:site-specific integrase [Pseudoduganella guangdongensis]MYN04391.1 tyrosine-type recombinase/integrase [Pseudoduganella guangdongensis]